MGGGGGDPVGEGDTCWDGPCSYEQSPGVNVQGFCESNSQNKCVCNAKTSSVILSICLPVKNNT